MSSPFRALDHIRLYRVVYSVGQLLCAAPRLIEEGIHAPIRLRERVGAILRAAQQQRQRDAFLPLTAAITGILIDVCRNIRGARVGIHILVGEGIHPQIDAKLLREGASAPPRSSAPRSRAAPSHRRTRHTRSPPGRERTMQARAAARAARLYFFSSCPPSYRSSVMAKNEPMADSGTAMAANIPQNRPLSTGRSPTSFPVCPFMAKRKSLPCHLVFSSHTGSSA